MRKLFLFLLLQMLCFVSLGQIENLDDILENEDLTEESKQEILQQLEDFKTLKFNINTITEEQMLLLGLSNFQIFSLQNYIRQSGQLFSLNELSFINGFDKEIIIKIAPYLYVENVCYKHSLNFDSILHKGRHIIRFQYKETLHKPYGYTRQDGKGYMGEKFSSSFRYNFKYYDRLEFSFVGDKDAGEPIRYKDKNFGYDHYNISFSLYDLNKYLKQITIGDYRISLGEGLVVKQNFDVGYFSNYGVKRSTGKITPFRSTSEYNYNRGMALKMNVKHFDIFLFASYNPLDFNGSSIQQTGYHRTQKELENKNSLHQTMIGTSLQYVYKGLQLGGSFLRYHFSDSIAPNIKSYPYQKYYFSGKDNYITGVNGSYAIRKFVLFFEGAMSQNTAKAYVVGLQYNLAWKTNLSLSYRDYDKKFQNFYANAIGIHSLNNNEQGIYIDFSHYVNKYFSYYVGGDFFYFPFISYRASKDVKGQKLKIQLNYQPQKQHSFLLYCRYSNRYYDYTNKDKTKTPFANTIIQNHLQYKFSSQDKFALTIRTGFSRSLTHESKENKGRFIFVETMYKALEKITFRLRYTLFNTSDYDNRFYVYEYSLPLSYSSSMLNGKGQNFYALFSYHINKYWQLYLKYSLIRYSDKDEISNGNDKIFANNNQFISGQVVLKF